MSDKLGISTLTKTIGVLVLLLIGAGMIAFFIISTGDKIGETAGKIEPRVPIILGFLPIRIFSKKSSRTFYISQESKLAYAV